MNTKVYIAWRDLSRNARCPVCGAFVALDRAMEVWGVRRAKCKRCGVMVQDRLDPTWTGPVQVVSREDTD